MSYRLLFIIALLLSATRIQAITTDTDYRFCDKSTEQFTAIVGQLTTRSGYILFADAELPIDPNQPVVRSSGETIPEADLSSDIYSVTIDGEDSDMFTAIVTNVSLVENRCVVKVFYNPTTAGSHRARLVAYCANAGAPYTIVNLSGEATPMPGDVDGDGKLGISDVTTLIDMLLRGE